MKELRGKSADVTASGATYLLTIRCLGGAIVAFPLTRIQSFTSARIRSFGDAIFNVKVRDYGYTLEWPELEIDFCIPEMVPEYLWITSAHAVARRAGSVASKAKAAAARANGARGGRPRKNVASG